MPHSPGGMSCLDGKYITPLDHDLLACQSSGSKRISGILSLILAVALQYGTM
jgi:hypothetical protein